MPCNLVCVYLIISITYQTDKERERERGKKSIALTITTEKNNSRIHLLL